MNDGFGFAFTLAGHVMVLQNLAAKKKDSWAIGTTEERDIILVRDSYMLEGKGQLLFFISETSASPDLHGRMGPPGLELVGKTHHLNYPYIS